MCHCLYRENVWWKRMSYQWDLSNGNSTMGIVNQKTITHLYHGLHLQIVNARLFSFVHSTVVHLYVLRLNFITQLSFVSLMFITKWLEGNAQIQRNVTTVSMRHNTNVTLISYKIQCIIHVIYVLNAMIYMFGKKASAKDEYIFDGFEWRSFFPFTFFL